MNEHDRKFLAVTAKMDGERAIVSSIGKKVKVSEMEMICLVTFAEIGLMSLFSQLDGKTGEDAAAELEQTLDVVRRTFAKNGDDGLTRLSASTAAMLRGEKFGKYVPG